MDITKHILVPKHILLNEEEKKEVLRKFNATLREFPRIRVSDPMVKKLGAKPGDLIKIIRESPTGGKVEYYRVVVRG